MKQAWPELQRAATPLRGTLGAAVQFVALEKRYGTVTALLPTNLQGLDRLVPTLTVKRIPEGTHWVVREKAPEVNLLIRDFIGRH